MNTPWGEVAVADAHVHLFSYRFFSLLAAQGQLSYGELPSKLGWDLPSSATRELAARWAGELDSNGVSQAALIASIPGDESSAAEAVAAFPERFFGYFMVNPTDPQAADRVASGLGRGLQGICLFPAMHRFSLHDDRILLLLDAASSHAGTVVFIHCGVLSVGVRARLGLPSHFDLRYSNPVDLHALALRYPGVPFVIPHFGAGYLREALMVADLCPNVHVDTSSSNSWIKYLPGLDLKSVFARALALAGPRRLLFGTDSSFFPRGWHKAVFDQQVDVLRQLSVSAEDAALILGGNLRRLHGR
jgi:hypothetical protein